MNCRLLFLIALISLSSSAFSAPETAEEWFHRTDVELQRVIDANGVTLEIHHSSGPDFHKLLLETELEMADGHMEGWHSSLYYGRPFGRYGLWKVGINHLSEPDTDWRFAAGLEYQLPYFIETEVTIYTGDKHTQVTLEAEREFAITQRWSLILGIEAEWANDTTPEQGISDGWNYWQPIVQLSYTANRNVSAKTPHRCFSPKPLQT